MPRWCIESATSSPNGAASQSRRGAIDIARGFSLLLVVVGHLSMSVIDRDSNGSLRGVNIIELYPRWEWLTMLSPMPLFFVASGWANTTTTIQSALGRVRALVGLGAVVVSVWFLAALVERLVTGSFGIVHDGARLATQPMWFLAAWVPFTMGSSFLTRISRRPIPAISFLIALLVMTDIARFVGGAPRWIGFPGFFAAWSVPWIFGAWWRQQFESPKYRQEPRRFPESRTGVAIFVGSVVAAIFLVSRFDYRAALIDAIPNKRSNTTPPTLFTAVAACVQVGVLMCCARSLDRLAKRANKLVAAVSRLSAGVYAWHLTALSLCGALLALGVWTPERLTAAWWWTRPVWFAAVLAVTAGFISLTQLFARRFATRTPTTQSSPPTMLIWLGAVSTSVGAGLIGLYGPRTFILVIVTPLLFTFGWYSARAHNPRKQHDAHRGHERGTIH